MLPAALQSRALVRVVDEVQSLLYHGEVSSSALRTLEGLGKAGLWREQGDALVHHHLAARKSRSGNGRTYSS